MAGSLLEPALRPLLRQSIATVQAALEALPEDRQHQHEYCARLDLALRELHGAFALTGAFAGERLTREMRALLAAGPPTDTACVALDDAALQLEACLDAEAETGVEADTGHWRAALNALRAARAEPAVGAAELFAARAVADRWPDRVARTAGAGGADQEPAGALARRELPGFQAAFLAWFRNPAADDALARIGTTAGAVARCVDDDRLRALWLGHAAFADQLIGRRIEALDTRRLLGRAVSQLKLLADGGEAAAGAQTGDTLWLLIHELACAESAAAQALLARLLPAGPARGPATGARRPDRASRCAALAALRSELATIKDAIDLHQRGSHGALADTGPRLLRAAKVVALLGVSDSAAVLRQLAEALAAAQDSADRAAWPAIAEPLLRIEAQLADTLQPVAPGSERLHTQEQREATAALHRELLIDSARIRTALERALHEPDADSDSRRPLAPLLHGLSAALRLAGSDAEADALAALAQQVAALPRLGPAEAAPLVAPIAALEAWLEARRDGSPRRSALAHALVRDIETWPLASPAPPPPPEVAASAAAAPEHGADAAGELGTLFVDEATEVLAGLAALRPLFNRDPGRAETLAAIRRAFHTLKGSGRTVGAEDIARLGAAGEQLLSRSLDGASALDDAQRVAIDEAIQALPTLLTAWRDGQPEPGAQARVLTDRLAQLGAAPATPAPDLRSVFCTDSRNRLAKLREWLARCDRQTSTVTIDDSLSRSFHTLKGAAAIVNAVALSRLAGMLEVALDTGQQAHRELPVAALALLEALMPSLDAWVEAVADEQPVPDDAADHHAERIARLHLPPPAETAPEAISPQVASASDADREVDAELQDIFFGEAQELLDALAASSGLWGGRPDDGRSLGSLRRGLHTLKGSARMAAATAIGAVAHHLETMLERPGDRPPAALLAAFDSGLDSLQRQLDALKRGERLAAAPLLALIDAALGTDGAPAVPAPAVAASLPPASSAFETAPASASDGNAATAVAAGVGGDLDADPESASALHDWLPGLFWTPDDADAASPSSRRETARVPVERLDAMLDQASEIAIARAQLDEHHAALKAQLAETTQTIARIRDQLRQMDIETDAQISARSSSRAAHGHEPEDRYAAEFDALEMDRYSRMQELSRALAESVGDLGSLHGSMEEALDSADSLLQQQGRQATELQQGLMSTLMVPFSRQEQRLTRVIRQTAQEHGRDAEPVYIGTDAELDRNVLERMTAPLEHLLRNAVVHGIEPPELRVAAGKSARGSIEIRLSRDGAQLLIEVGDDGRGLDYPAIRAQAIARGQLTAQADASDAALARFILEPGFTTARHLTEDAGRGIGMDVVVNQVRQLGGTLALHSETGRGARFTIRLPLALAVSQALLVGVGEETFAIPLTAIEGVGRLPREQAERLLAGDRPRFHFADEDWRLGHLADVIDLPRGSAGDSRQVNAVLVRLASGSAGDDRRLALIVDRVLGHREIVSKAAGPQLGSVAGIGGATILADGRVAMILDLPTLVAEHPRRARRTGDDDRFDPRLGAARATVLVVDDSITIRRVAERLLLRHGYRVLSARDGVEAMALLHREMPDAVLLDIEMPRADGFEVAAFIRKQPRLAALPVVMITSRSGDKHRARARQLGVDHYLTKPWQDDQLLATLRSLPGIRP